MKKLLSLLLALAMVFSVVPFAFAEEVEDPTPSYDMAYAYTLEPDKTFVGGAEGLISDYDGGLKPDRDQHINSGTTPAADMADLFGIGYWWGNGFYGNTRLNRPSVNHYAPDDINNVHKLDGTGMASLAFTYNASIDSADGDYANGIDSAGTMAYNFSAGRYDELAMTSDTDNNSSYYGRNSLPAIRFKSPKTGYINPVLKLATLDADGLLYRVSKVHLIEKNGKLNHAGWGSTNAFLEQDNAIWTTVYPMDGEETFTRVSTAVNEVFAPMSGWAKAPANVMTTRDDALIYVQAGDELIITFGKTGSDNTEFAIDTIRMDYVDAFELDVTADFVGYRPLVNLPELLADTDISLAKATITTDDTHLKATATAGVYEIKNSVTDGHEAVVTVALPGMTLKVNVTINVPKTVYDLGEAYATTKVFTGDAVADYSAQLTPVTPMSKTNMWYLAYGYGGDTTYAYNRLSRPVYNAYAPEDTQNPFRLAGTGFPSMSFSYSAPTSTTVDGKTYAHNQGSSWGNIAYNFGAGALNDTSRYNTMGSLDASNYGSLADPVIVFTAPKSGLVNPQIAIGTKNSRGLAYRMFKNNDKTATVYPKANEEKTTISQPKGNSMWADGWAISAAGEYTVRDDAYVWLNKGDTLTLRLDAAVDKAGAVDFTLDVVKMVYTYTVDEELNYTFNGDEEIVLDLASQIASYGMTPTSFELTNDNGALMETEEGVYTIVGNTIEGAVIEALAGEYKFTYTIHSNAELISFEADENGVSADLVVNESYEGKKFLAVAYDENDEIVGVTNDEVYEYGEIYLYVETSEKAAYVRMFFWEDLTNIRPYSASLLLK